MFHSHNQDQMNDGSSVQWVQPSSSSASHSPLQYAFQQMQGVREDSEVIENEGQVFLEAQCNLIMQVNEWRLRMFAMVELDINMHSPRLQSDISLLKHVMRETRAIDVQQVLHDVSEMDSMRGQFKSLKVHLKAYIVAYSQYISYNLATDLLKNSQILQEYFFYENETNSVGSRARNDTNCGSEAIMMTGMYASNPSRHYDDEWSSHHEEAAEILFNQTFNFKGTRDFTEQQQDITQFNQQVEGEVSQQQQTQSQQLNHDQEEEEDSFGIPQYFSLCEAD